MQAHAYAYGGSINQDLGYYLFGSKFYSDLTALRPERYFILNLIRESRDMKLLLRSAIARPVRMHIRRS